MSHTALARKNIGFTLIELVVVIAILGIVLGIAVPNFVDMVRGQRIKTAAFDVVANLQLMRSEAIKRNGNIVITPAAGTNWRTGWVAYIDANTNFVFDSGDTLIRGQWVAFADADQDGKFDGVDAITYGQGAPNGLSITGPTRLTYNRNGRATAVGSNTISLDTDPASGSERARCITIDTSGRPATAKGICS